MFQTIQLQVKYGISDYEEVVGRKDFDFQPKLHFEAKDPKWMTEEDLMKYARDGRSWAELIFEVIMHMARRHSRTLGSFLGRSHHTELRWYKVYDIIKTCSTCLERLRPEVFFPPH